MCKKTLTPDERRLLKYLYMKLGSRTKTMIHDAWQTGIYDARLVYNESDESTLQRLRNTHGPSWLSSLKLSQL